MIILEFASSIRKTPFTHVILAVNEQNCDLDVVNLLMVTTLILPVLQQLPPEID